MGADQLLPGVEADALLDDGIGRGRTAADVTAVIAPKRNRVVPREDDKDLYQARHLLRHAQAVHWPELQQGMPILQGSVEQTAAMWIGQHL